MPPLLEKHLPVITIAMSLPLFFSFQLKRPPEFLSGLPFVALWSWGVLAAITVPILAAVEIVICSWLLWHRTAAQSTLLRHGAAFFVAVVAEVVFVLARRSPA